MRTLVSALSMVLLLAMLAACVESESAGDSAEGDPGAADATAPAEPDEPDPTPPATAEPEPTATAEPEEAETPTSEAADDVEGADAEPAEHIIEIQDPHDFDPEALEIAVGDTVTFVNEGRINHTATLDPEIARDADNAVLPDGAETWDSGDMAPGDEFSITLEVPGEYTYFCRPHEVLGQIGTITVNGDDASAGDDPDDDPVDSDDSEDDDEIDDYL